MCLQGCKRHSVEEKQIVAVISELKNKRDLKNTVDDDDTIFVGEETPQGWLEFNFQHLDLDTVIKVISKRREILIILVKCSYFLPVHSCPISVLLEQRLDDSANQMKLIVDAIKKISYAEKQYASNVDRGLECFRNLYSNTSVSFSNSVTEFTQ